MPLEVDPLCTTPSLLRGNNFTREKSPKSSTFNEIPISLTAILCQHKLGSLLLSSKLLTTTYINLPDRAAAPQATG